MNYNVEAILKEINLQIDTVDNILEHPLEKGRWDHKYLESRRRALCKAGLDLCTSVPNVNVTGLIPCKLNESGIGNWHKLYKGYHGYVYSGGESWNN